MEDQVRWALQFADYDLEQLRAGDRLNLLEDMHEFFVVPDPWRLVVTPYGLPLPESSKEKDWQDIRSLQGKVRALFDGLVRAKQAWGEAISVMELHELQMGPSLTPPVANADPAVERQRAALFFAGPWQDAFLLLLGLALWRADLTRLVRCPECQKTFLRVRRQRYCGRTCANKAGVRAWREQEEKRERERTLARQRYKAKQRKRLGNVRVGRKG